METLYAYLAGAIDIDGRISISRARDYRRGDREITYYSAVISVAYVGSRGPKGTRATHSPAALSQNQTPASGAGIVADHLDAIRQGWKRATTLGRARAGQTFAIRTGEVAQCVTTANEPVVTRSRFVPGGR